MLVPSPTSLFHYAKRSHGAENHLSLAKEIIGGKNDKGMPFWLREQEFNSEEVLKKL